MEGSIKPPMMSVQMTTKQFLRISAISLGLLDAGSVLAQERVTQMRHEKQQVRQQASQKGEVDQDALRNQVQTRLRAMSQEERALMNDLSINGRQRLEAENAMQSTQGRGMGRDGGMEGSRFGRGYESRQMQQNPTAAGGASMNGAGSGPGMGTRGGGGGGRGR
jgi:hypothetical protein